MNEQYVRAYQQTPETEEEIQAARRVASSVLAEEPWQEAEQEARKKGLLRLEGKSYIVQDGDVITSLFNV